MKKNILFLFFSLFTVFFFTSCQKKTEQSQTQNAASAQSNISMIASVEKVEGNKAPNFSWTDENGKKITLAEYTKGQAAMINFWATWCPPCKRELPDIVALSEEYKTKGAKVIGISTDKDADVMNLVSSFAKEHHLTYPIIIDNDQLADAFGGIRGIPTTFFVNGNGEIVKKLVGLQSKETFAQELEAAMK